MKSNERRVQTFVAADVHRTLKMRAAQADTTITQIVRELVNANFGSQRTPVKDEPRHAG